MSTNAARAFLAELIAGAFRRVQSLEEAIADPGTVHEVGEAAYFEHLEALPPQFMDGATFCFAEGASAYLLFWRRQGQFFVRQLTWDETRELA